LVALDAGCEVCRLAFLLDLPVQMLGRLRAGRESSPDDERGSRRPVEDAVEQIRVALVARVIR
jgi:hypothetical protein